MNTPSFLPVPVRPRHDGWTPDRQLRFIQILADTASIAEAARAIGLSESSAYRLRSHPQAEDFRAAWDAALTQAYGRLEQIALDRALNGETETICRDGDPIYTKHRPCSDRLLIHLLKERTRKTEARETARAAVAARAAAPVSYWNPKPPPAPPTAAEEETTALQSFQTLTQNFPDRNQTLTPDKTPLLARTKITRLSATP